MYYIFFSSNGTLLVLNGFSMVEKFLGCTRFFRTRVIGCKFVKKYNVRYKYCTVVYNTVVRSSFRWGMMKMRQGEFHNNFTPLTKKNPVNRIVYIFLNFIRMYIIYAQNIL